MAVRQQRVYEVARGVERQGVGALLGHHGLDPAQRAGVEHLDETGIADRHIEPGKRGVEEDHVGHAGELSRADDGAGVGVELDEPPGVARAEQPAGGDVEVEPMGAGEVTKIVTETISTPSAAVAKAKTAIRQTDSRDK